MPSFGLLGLLDALQAGLGRMAPSDDGEPESRQLAPLWRAACWFKLLLVPLVFILLCWAMVKFIYRDIPLEDDDAA